MATKLDISGAWTGEYRYSTPDEEALGAVGFTLMLNKGWFGKFCGTVQNDPAKGMLEEGEVSGRLLCGRLKMEKRYPVCRVSYKGQLQTIGEMLRDQGVDVPEDVEPPHLPIEYKGAFTDQNMAEGSWLIHAGTIEFWGFAWQISSTFGTWRMWRNTRPQPPSAFVLP
ncbi:MAG: hypothetical protein JWO08_2250 [Verrucomicrobiaceae bacterium]|nr:hypothetical protein [Verrucomicrobiaceae bacterium]